MLKKLTQKRNKKGFTLVELVVVIAILGILAAIAVPKLSGFKESAALSADKATAASIVKAADLYTVSNGKSPDNIEALVKAELLDSKVANAQKKDRTFLLKRDAKDVYYVTYDDYATATGDNKVILYPENFDPAN